MPFEIFQITAAYSNAMLIAIMPHVSDFAKKLDLPTPQPVVQAQVRRFNCFPRSDHIGGRVILTNGCEFIFDHGRVGNFVSPRSYFYLQNPDLVPKFYGKVNLSEAQALQVARDAIKKLGYTDAMLSADRSPEITPPERDGNHTIARYRIRWRDPNRGGNPHNLPTSADFEVDATSGQIDMVNIPNPNTYGTDLSLGVIPPVIGAGPQSVPIGPGRKVTPVSSEYAQSFLYAILPQLADFVKKGNLAVKAPLTTDDVDMSRYLAKYNCGIVEGDPRAYVDTKVGVRFLYSHGQVVAFYATDAMHNPNRKRSSTYPGIDEDQAKYFGHVNMSTNEAVALIRETVRKLGYSEAMLHIDTPPQRIDPPGWWGTNQIARCFVVWSDEWDGPIYVDAEVDLSRKTVKSLYINDHMITNIWRKPPMIDVPPKASAQ